MQKQNVPVEARIRVNLSHTLKDGWRHSETTVEVTGTYGLNATDDPAFVWTQDGETCSQVPVGLLTELLRAADQAGQAEADRRNSDDRIELGDALVARGGK